VEKYRINWIDYAKGIAIILVVYGHMIRGLSKQITPSIFYISDTLVYGFHMPLFFFLAGLFVAKWSNSTPKVAIKKKLLTIAYPYFLWSILQGGINIILSRYTNSEMDIKTLFNIVFTPISQFWFLYVLFFIYLLYYLLKKFLSIKTIFLISFFMFFLTPFINFWIFKLIFSNLIFFTSSSLIFSKFNMKYLENICTTKILLLAFTIFSLSNYFFISHNKNMEILVRNIISLPIGFIGIGFCVILAVVLAKNNILSKLKYLGSLSMVIYLAHTIFSAGTRIVLIKLFHIDNIYLVILFGVLFGILLPVVLYKVSTRFKLVKLLFGNEIKVEEAESLLH